MFLSPIGKKIIFLNDLSHNGINLASINTVIDLANFDASEISGRKIICSPIPCSDIINKFEFLKSVIF